MKSKKLTSVIMYIVLFIVFIALFLVLRWFYSTRTEDTYERPTSPVEVTTPEVRTLTKEITLSSYVSADSTIPVTAYLDGTLIEYYVQEGDYVKEGDVIAKIDPEPYELQRQQAEAAYTAYQSSFERVEKLYKNESASKQDYDTVKAQRDAYKAQLELAELQVSYTDVTAKTNGTILKTILSKGSTASQGTPVATIADLTNLTVDLNLGEQYYALFADAYKNTAYKITVTRPATTYSEEKTTTATIKAVSPYIDSTSKNFKLYLKLDDPTYFNPGMFVKVTIEIESQTGYSIEKSALKLDNSVYYVQENEDGYTAKRIDLSNAFSSSEYVIIPEEYKDEKFIIKGQNDLFSGQPVAITDSSSKTNN